MPADGSVDIVTDAGPNRRARRLVHQLGGAARGLPLSWKLMLPFTVLMVAVGTLGTYVLVSDSTSRAETALENEAGEHAVDARAILHDRELYLAESATYGANLAGMADAVRRQDAAAVGRLLQSVVALKTDVEIAAVVGGTGATLSELRRGPAGKVGLVAGQQWAHALPIRSVLQGANGASGFVDVGGTLLVTAAPICTGLTSCDPAGAALVAVSAESLARGAAGPPSRRDDVQPSSVAIYAADGSRLAAAGAPTLPARAPASAGGETAVSRVEADGGTDVLALYTPLVIGGRRAGSLAVAVPRQATMAAVQETAVRVLAVMLVAILGSIAIGALLSRWILRQLRALLATHRAIGAGDLDARVAVVGSDELGELAAGVNEMAERLRASHETLEAQVAQRTDEVRRLLRARTDFFAGLSHELRTPLAVIRAQADMLSDSTMHRGDGGAAAGRTISLCADEVLHVVNEILDLARHDAGGVELELGSVDLRDEVAQLQPTIDALAGANGISASVNMPPLPAVCADRRRLREVLLNLLDNAIKYTPAGGRVSMWATADAGGVVLHIADSGVGIAPGIGDRVFEPFYRAPGTSTQRGQASSGLGLALTRKLVEAQGGTISYESEPGAGTVFHVRLATVGPLMLLDDALPSLEAQSGAGGSAASVASVAG
jgi:signal transduction histidine kinase